MADFLGLADDLAVPEIIEGEAANHATNQIDRENFVNQGAQQNKILEPVQNCKAEQSKVDAYSNLYSHLVEKEVIIQEIGAATVITWLGVSRIDPKKTDTSTLKSLLTPSTIELYCYSINYAELSSFLKNYKYVSSDQIAIVSTAYDEEVKQREQPKDETRPQQKLLNPPPTQNIKPANLIKKRAFTRTIKMNEIKRKKQEKIKNICQMCKERNIGGKRTRKAKRKSKRSKN